MRSLRLALIAGAAIASPALAQDVGPYAGVEGGFLFPRDTNFDAEAFVFDGTNASFENLGELDLKRGWDLDAIAGYNFGRFRIEGELGLKQFKVGDFQLDRDIVADLEGEDGWIYIDPNFTFDRARVASFMGNALAQVGTGGLRLYGGGGFGRARVKILDDRDRVWAWQLIAGVGVPITPNLVLGAKYRFFHTKRLDLEEIFSGTPGRYADFFFRNDSRFSSHSLLASMILGFGARPQPAYAPPVAQQQQTPPFDSAMQTCPDRSMILATETCPTAAPPAPAPVSSPPQGERG